MDRYFSWPDIESWQFIHEGLKGTKVTKTTTLEALRSLCIGIQVFHACKPIDVSSYYEKGLQLSKSDLIDRQAVEIFFGSNPTDDQLLALKDAKAKIGNRDDEKLWVSIDHRALARHSRHFLSYGSERLYSLSTNMVGDTSRHTQELKRIGSPTFFRARTCWHCLTDAKVERLADRVAQNLKCVCATGEVPATMFDMVLHQAISPEDILEHWIAG